MVQQTNSYHCSSRLSLHSTMQPREVFLQDSFRMRVKGIKSKDLRTLSRATGTQSICERNEDVLHGDSDSAVFKVTNELCPSLFCSFTSSMTHKRPHSAFTQACHSPLLSGSNKHQRNAVKIINVALCLDKQC